MTLRVRCPAKVNLFLAVGPKDSRDYHPLRTIYQAIDLSDAVTLRTGSGRHKVMFDDPSIPEENTVTKALRLLSEVLNLPPLLITVEKRIPPESGLGGGSSDAAGVIRAAQAMIGVTIPAGELNGIAEAIGMDVPFFLVGGRARAEGYGQIVTPLPDSAPEWFVVARPRFGSSTAQAYRRLDEHPYRWRDFPESDELYNDFERIAPVECQTLIEMLKSNGARDAALSGSGSAVFGRFATREDSDQAKKNMHHSGAYRLWVTRSLSRAESHQTF